MKKFCLTLIIIFFCSVLIYEKNKTNISIGLSYSVWEDSQLTQEEFVVWKRNALLSKECSYPVWEENEISRKNPLTVWRME